MRALWPFARKRGIDLLIVVAAISGAAEVIFKHDPLREPRATDWIVLPAVVLVVLPLLARRRFPFAAPAALWLLAAALSFLDGRIVVYVASIYIAGLVASLLLGNLRDAFQARLGLAITVAGALIVVSNDPRHTAGEFVFIPVLFAIAWLPGFALRERASQAEAAEERALQAERERETAARIAVAEERARIARELHDVVAHAVSVMVLQVGAVRHNLPGHLEDDRGALSNVEEAGRTALTEMRRLLGAMRADGDDLELTPQPGLESLDALLDEVGRAGLPVRLHVEGERRALSPTVDLSAYRIVQEGLTNALKHAHASSADVTVHYEPHELEIQVRDDGTGSAASDGLGHGLVGIRERVKIYGGAMSAGKAAEGGFVLNARLPLGGETR